MAVADVRLRKGIGIGHSALENNTHYSTCMHVRGARGCVMKIKYGAFQLKIVVVSQNRCKSPLLVSYGCQALPAP